MLKFTVIVAVASIAAMTCATMAASKPYKPVPPYSTTTVCKVTTHDANGNLIGQRTHRNVSTSSVSQSGTPGAASSTVPFFQSKTSGTNGVDTSETW